MGTERARAVGAIVGIASLVLAGCGAVSGDAREGRAATVAGEAPQADVVGPSSPKPVRLIAAAVTEIKASCPVGMVPIEDRYCIDRYEASLVEVLPNGEERRFSPFSTVGSRSVRAVSEPDVFPQGYISEVQAKTACAASGKRLCNVSEWQAACRGPENRRWGYGDERAPGKCNDEGRNPIRALFGFRYDASTMNRPQVNQLDGTLAKTGAHNDCSNGYGVYDMVGNLHEWVADSRGTFYGGYYQDVASVGHGEGCGYHTTAHAARYHDYSTGFRCCTDIAGDEDPAPKQVARSVSRPRPKVKPRTRR